MLGVFRVALGACLALVVTAAALASNYGSNSSEGGFPTFPCNTTVNSQCVADNGTHKVYLYSGLPSNMKTAMRTAISWFDSNTSAVVFEYPFFPDANVTHGSYSTINALAWGQCTGGATYGGSDPNRWLRPSAGCLEYVLRGQPFQHSRQEGLHCVP